MKNSGEQTLRKWARVSMLLLGLLQVTPSWSEGGGGGTGGGTHDGKAPSGQWYADDESDLAVSIGNHDLAVSLRGRISGHEAAIEASSLSFSRAASGSVVADGEMTFFCTGAGVETQFKSMPVQFLVAGGATSPTLYVLGQGPVTCSYENEASMPVPFHVLAQYKLVRRPN